MAKRPVPLYDFAAFGQAIKGARTERKESRKDVSDAMNISPRYLTNIENKGLRIVTATAKEVAEIENSDK